MPLETQTIYNAAYSNCIYKDKLDYYKNNGELKNNNICSEFINRNLIIQDDPQKVCKAVILFLSHLKENKVVTYGDTAYGDITYKDNGCKYLFYWLYSNVLKNGQTIENVLNMYKDLYRIYTQHHDNLNTFHKYINEMNEHTSDKLVKLTNLYNELDDFFTKNEKKKEKEVCKGDFIILYNNYVEECQNGYDYDFCDELKNFRKKYNSFIQKVMKCEELYLLPPVERFDILGTTIIPFSFISVTSLILPILYKFTAFGPWIRNLIGKNENIYEYINEETNQSLNTYEIEDDILNMRNYNIPYNSS
ncbi:PIR Superfamily Protein [Plasmodium ovale wallikeri]|uniref:Plasmodium vivax Vir protein, putative n=2 Tax=Plasmodium ovale TaxID=36330 RepID=A0A1C3KJC7_PLAOA|nr:PIR Superfamily Protein [Plasmodium ovale wallikeri]SBT73977.1 Plasmodium vivax Vir protein, putative [Plasmodium ovale]